MSTAWELLCAWGVPAGAVRPVPAGALPASQVAGALRELVGRGFQGLDPAEREALLAWLRAFRHQWPRRFEAILGDTGAASLAALATVETDPDRYLKLRRIAVENLSASL